MQRDHACLYIKNVHYGIFGFIHTLTKRGYMYMIQYVTHIIVVWAYLCQHAWLLVKTHWAIWGARSISEVFTAYCEHGDAQPTRT